ncbi:MAG: hypothetical protein KDA66_19210 [Planctomycetaceae bacterium]|nr:hypothetical protein [Planctomycetaceae bacterium]
MRNLMGRFGALDCFTKPNMLQQLLNNRRSRTVVLRRLVAVWCVLYSLGVPAFVSGATGAPAPGCCCSLESRNAGTCCCCVAKGSDKESGHSCCQQKSHPKKSHGPTIRACGCGNSEAPSVPPEAHDQIPVVRAALLSVVHVDALSCLTGCALDCLNEAPPLPPPEASC